MNSSWARPRSRSPAPPTAANRAMSRRSAAWLARIGLSAADLECGAHLPYDEPSMRALVRAGQQPDAAYNNCSGKHTGFLTTAVHLRAPTKGYIRYEHPIQQRLLGILEQTCGPRSLRGAARDRRLRHPHHRHSAGQYGHGHGAAGRSGRAAARPGRGGGPRGRGDDGGALYGRRPGGVRAAC